MSDHPRVRLTAQFNIWPTKHLLSPQHGFVTQTCLKKITTELVHQDMKWTHCSAQRSRIQIHFTCNLGGHDWVIYILDKNSVPLKQYYCKWIALHLLAEVGVEIASPDAHKSACGLQWPRLLFRKQNWADVMRQWHNAQRTFTQMVQFTFALNTHHYARVSQQTVVVG